MKINWPEPDDYRRLRNREMPIGEQEDFIKILQKFCEVYLRKNWRTLSRQDIDDLVNDAIFKHITTYNHELGIPQTNLSTILKHRAIDLVKKPYYKSEIAIEGGAEKAGFETTDDYLDSLDVMSDALLNNTVTDVARLFESAEQTAIFKTIYYCWDDLPPYPWKDIVHLYLHWWFEADNTNTSKTEFIAYIKSEHGIKTRVQTIRNYINQGLAQLTKWVINGEPLPINIKRIDDEIVGSEMFVK